MPPHILSYSPRVRTSIFSGKDSLRHYREDQYENPTRAGIDGRRRGPDAEFRRKLLLNDDYWRHKLHSFQVTLSFPGKLPRQKYKPIVGGFGSLNPAILRLSTLNARGERRRKSFTSDYYRFTCSMCNFRTASRKSARELDPFPFSHFSSCLLPDCCTEPDLVKEQVLLQFLPAVAQFRSQSGLEIPVWIKLSRFTQQVDRGLFQVL